MCIRDRHQFAEVLATGWKQDVVRAATIMVIGAGALGNEVLKNLALMGVGLSLIHI